MNVTVAIKTLRQIDGIVQADQGSAFRGWLGQVIPHMGDAYRTDEDGFRGHLGASQLGSECGRAIWYGFRWVTKGEFPGRILRLFNRGHLEEARFIAMLLMIGCHVYQQDENGKQYRISFADGHGGGSGDGLADRIPDLHPDTLALCEFKTHGEKSFIDLAGPIQSWRDYVDGKGPFKGKGVRDSKFEHYVQMQLYMRKMGVASALYMAVNKNTDDLYAEIITLNPELGDQFLARGEKLVWMSKPPDKINESPGFWKCKFCDHNRTCHFGAAPNRNCRTCEFSIPMADGKGEGNWECRHPDHSGPIDKNRQLKGCDKYKVASYYK